MLRRIMIVSVTLGFAACAVAIPLRAIPKRAFIKLVPSPYDGFFIKTGNVEVVLKDGHKEVWTHDGDCHIARVSNKGDVGWIKIDKQHINERMLPDGKDSLVVRRADGTFKEFPPYDGNWFIEDWRFADDGSAIILRSMGHHGPSSFVKYALATGKVENSCEGYIPYDQLPIWAKPLGAPRDN